MEPPLLLGCTGINCNAPGGRSIPHINYPDNIYLIWPFNPAIIKTSAFRNRDLVNPRINSKGIENPSTNLQRSVGLCMANYYLRSCGQLIKATTMRLPLELAELSVATYGFSVHLYRRSVIKCSMYTVRVVIQVKIDQLSLQVTWYSRRSVWSRNSRRMVPISRSTKGCDSGAYGTVLTSSAQVSSGLLAIGDTGRGDR